MREESRYTLSIHECDADNAARFEHDLDVAELADVTGVPAELLDLCPTREAMELFADLYHGAAMPEDEEAPVVHSAPTAPKSRLHVDTTKPPTNAEIFAEMLTDRFGYIW